MATTPDPVFIGQLIQIPMVANGNGGVDRCPAIITEVGDEAPGGGIEVSVRPLPNNINLNLGIIQVTYCVYDSEARALGFTGLLNNVPLGGWPLDYTWA